MQFLDLPLDILKIVISSTVRELGLEKSMKARLTCRIFADEIIDAVIKTRLVEEVTSRFVKLTRIDYHQDVIARYLYHRVRTDSSAAHPWITTIGETCRLLAQYTNSENNVAQAELLERSACLCLAVNAGCSVFEILNGEDKDDKMEFESGSTSVNCLATAAWMGDKNLVELLSKGLDPDPPSFFGRPSWAAAAQGHLEIVQFFLDRGALPYEPTFSEGPNFKLSKSPLCAAAYMGHENIVRLYLQPSHYCPEVRHEQETAISYAAQGNQPTILKYLLEHYREVSKPHEFLYAIDGALVWSCRRGAAKCVRVLINYGADVNESDPVPRSCLQLAAIAGDTQVVKMLLDAGASLEPTGWVHRRTSTRPVEKRCQPSALKEASRRDNHEIKKLIADKHQELSGRGS